MAWVLIPRASSHSRSRLTVSDFPAPPTPVTITTTETSANGQLALGVQQRRADLGGLALVGGLVDLMAQLGGLEHCSLIDGDLKRNLVGWVEPRASPATEFAGGARPRLDPPYKIPTGVRQVRPPPSSRACSS